METSMWDQALSRAARTSFRAAASMPDRPDSHRFFPSVSPGIRPEPAHAGITAASPFQQRSAVALCNISIKEKTMFRQFIRIGLAALALFFATGVTAQNLSIATGGTGGVYYPLGGGMA